MSGRWMWGRNEGKQSGRLRRGRLLLYGSEEHVPLVVSTAVVSPRFVRERLFLFGVVAGMS